MLPGSLYEGYLYSYPHKLAYRPLAPRRLTEVWQGEPVDRLSLYAHVPFCEMRCGFCNLFTTPRPPASLVERWLSAWMRTVEATRAALPEASFADFAIGGGTPTWLAPRSLERVLDGLAQLGADLAAIPGSVEVSPSTVTAEHAQLMVGRGVTRVSMGVQSLEAAEVEAVFRPQDRSGVEEAVRRLRDAAVPQLNLDLMYGLPGQTATSLVRSIDAVLDWAPEEVFLYPLYVRPKTGLFRQGGTAADEARRALYRTGRDRLLDAGYVQRSMRLFCRPEVAGQARDFGDPDRNMVGLGVGARSYTRTLHFSSRYAVRNAGVRAILEDWIATDPTRVDWGIVLSEAERRRRSIVLRLLDVDGVDAAQHGRDPRDDVPELQRLVDAELATWSSGVLRLTASGLERSDQIGPWLISEAVRQRIATAEVT
ncbi:MAG: STM4012 family radical SAM protein [Myxococcota bacterium]